MSERKIVLIGYSGHGMVVAETAKDTHMNLCCYTEKQPMMQNPYHLDYLGFEGDDTFSSWDESYDFILGIGSNAIRENVAKLILSKNKRLVNVVSGFANISEYSTIGQGNFIAKNVVINIFAKIGDYCILNTGCIVEHDCDIANGVHVAPGAVLLGGVKIGEHSFIGANSVIKEKVTIGQNVVIGAGSVVINDVADHSKIVGNPGRAI